MSSKSWPLLALLLSASCAPTAPPGSWTLASGQRCYAEEPSERRAVLSDLVDLAALEAALADVPLLARAAGDTTAFMVHYDSLGAPGEVRWFHPEASREEREFVAATIRRHLNPRAAPGSHASALLIRTAPVQVIAWNFSFSCAPFLQNRDEITRRLRAVAGRAERLENAVMRFLIDGDGRILERSFTRTTLSPALDREIHEILGAARFLPALLEGHPIPVWLSFPVSLSTRP
jgi:hypothetical protein